MLFCRSDDLKAVLAPAHRSIAAEALVLLFLSYASIVFLLDEVRSELVLFHVVPELLVGHLVRQTARRPRGERTRQSLLLLLLLLFSLCLPLTLVCGLIDSRFEVIEVSRGLARIDPSLSGGIHPTLLHLLESLVIDSLAILPLIANLLRTVHHIVIVVCIHKVVII